MAIPACYGNINAVRFDMAIFPFEISARQGAARTGVLKTSRGNIRTPAFMPVGTAGTVKGLYMDQVRDAGSDIILGNTYHLMLRPGAERVKRLGGLHKFGGWDGPILTDSGDISMQLDECTDYPSPHEKAAESMRLSLRWGQRSLAAFGERETQTLFAIIQGSVYEDLRLESIQQSVAESTSGGYGGYAIGGLAVGEGHAAMCDVLDFTAPHLPIDRPRYLMGVGKPIDLVEAVARGVDMFDCVIPTRSGRHGQVWTDKGPYNIKKAEFSDDDSPLDINIA